MVNAFFVSNNTLLHRLKTFCSPHPPEDASPVYHNLISKSYLEAESYCELFHLQMTMCTDLDRRIQTMEEEIVVNPQYVKKSCGATEEDLTAGQGTKISYLM